MLLKIGTGLSSGNISNMAGPPSVLFLADGVSSLLLADGASELLLSGL